MSIKGDKTFEEIVERLVALFRPQPEDTTAGTGSHASPSEPLDGPQPPSTPPSTDEDAPN